MVFETRKPLAKCNRIIENGSFGIKLFVGLIKKSSFYVKVYFIPKVLNEYPFLTNVFLVKISKPTDEVLITFMECMF